MILPVFRPSIKRKDMDGVLSCMVSDSIGPGQIANELAGVFSSYFKTDYALLLRDYKRAIATVFSAAGLTDESRVVLSPLLPFVYADVCNDFGIQPDFVDVDSFTACLDVEAVNKLDGTVDCLILNTALGFVPNYELLRSDIPCLIEDISQGAGSYFGEKMCGSMGQFAILSLEAKGVVTSGGGIAILSSSRKHSGALKATVENYEVEAFLSDMNAALGLAQMKEIEKFLEQRKQLSSIFSRALLKSRHKTLHQQDDSGNIYYSFPVVFEAAVKDARGYARKYGIDTELAFGDSIFNNYSLDVNLPNSAVLAQRCILFPLYPTLTKQNVSQIEKVLSTLP